MPSPEKLLRYMWGCAPALIIETALRNKIFDTLSNGPMTVREASARGLTPLMDALTGLELLVKDGDTWSLASGKPGDLGGLLDQISALSSFTYEGGSAAADILGVAAATAPVRLLDLAAGSGVWAIAIAQKSPYVNVTAADLEITRQTAGYFGLADRFTFIAEADFGTGYDIATLGDVSKELLKKAFNALAPGGTIIVAEFEGFEETKAELEEAGFIRVGLVPVPGPSPLIFADKP